MLTLPKPRDPHPFVSGVSVRYPHAPGKRPNYRLSIYVSGASYGKRYSANLDKLVEEADHVMNHQKHHGGLSPLQAVIERSVGEITGNRSGWKRIIAVLPFHRTTSHYEI